MSRRTMRPAALLFACLLLAPALTAHEVRPALLHLQQQPGEQWRATWKVPAVGKRVLAVKPRWPESWRVLNQAPGVYDNGAWTTFWTLAVPDGDLAGAALEIDNLAATRSDVLLLVDFRDGRVMRHVFRPNAPRFQVPAAQSPLAVAWDYGRIGVWHIFEGADHLLFLLALWLLVPGRLALLKAVTAFTLAHSLTLTLATLQWVALAPPLVEALIALSVLFMAVALLRLYRADRDTQPDLIQRRPWHVSFAFGLIHGFGFAGALAEIGLPHQHLPPALLSFNLGVEVGQVLFLAALTLCAGAAQAVATPVRMARLVRLGAIYMIGSLAAFYVIERTWALM